ncbi:MAG: ABC-2 transporter permease [Vagococcus sp.]|uniref:ABC-2 transporter permease n=1 Tax=Vagococcus sp. TaxID=1933889 RepID=UPI002FC823E7
MTALLLKDFYLMKRNIKGMLLMVLLFSFIGWRDNTHQMMIAVIPIITLLGISLFNYDQNAHFDSFAMTLPITKNSYVLEKIIFGFLLAGIGALFSALMLVTKSLIASISFHFILSGVLLGFLISLMVYLIALPIFFKYPIEIARTYFIGFTLLISFGGAFLIEKLSLPTITISTIFIFSFILCGILLIGSYLLSLNIFKRKFE